MLPSLEHITVTSRGTTYILRDTKDNTIYFSDYSDGNKSAMVIVSGMIFDLPSYQFAR